MKLTARISLILFLMTGILTGCGGSQELQDGYYTAQAQEFSHGWKEYVTIMVKGGSIVSVEYNAENASGFIKSWDNAYMQNMLHSNGTYPNEYTRNYAGQLLEGQGKGQIDAISGAFAGIKGQSFRGKRTWNYVRRQRPMRWTCAAGLFFQSW